MEIHLDANGVPGSIRFIPVTGMYVDTPATAYRTGIWTHVVATYNYATGTGTMYVNGGNKVTKTLTPLDMSADPVHFLMGVRNDGSYGYTGQMGQVALFNRALSDQEALDLYNTDASVGYAGGLVALWDGNGTNVDSVGKLPTGGFNPRYLPWKNGRFAYDLDTDDSVIVADAPALHLPSYSISLWFKATSTGVQFLTAKGNEHMEIHLDANNVPGSIRFIPVTGMYVDTNNAAYQTGNWTHVVGTYDVTSGTGTIYVNGMKQAAKTMAPQNMSGDTGTFRVGRRGTGYYVFDGLMAQVALFNRALSDQEALDLYNTDASVGYAVTSSVTGGNGTVSCASPIYTGGTSSHAHEQLGTVLEAAQEYGVALQPG